MKYDPTKHHRRSIRLKGYDYHNAGAYFITICTKHRECVLEDSIVRSILLDVWNALPQWFPMIELDEFVVMPNHVHFVVWILPPVGMPVGMPVGVPHVGMPVGMPLAGILQPDGGEPLPYRLPTPQKTNDHPSLGDIVGAFKSLVFTVYYDYIRSNNVSKRAKFWQTNYYEHIVRNNRELNAIRRYIIENPMHWKLDRDNAGNLRKLPAPSKVEEYLEDIDILLGAVEDKETTSS